MLSFKELIKEKKINDGNLTIYYGQEKEIKKHLNYLINGKLKASKFDEYFKYSEIRFIADALSGYFIGDGMTMIHNQMLELIKEEEIEIDETEISEGFIFLAQSKDKKENYYNIFDSNSGNNQWVTYELKNILNSFNYKYNSELKSYGVM